LPNAATLTFSGACLVVFTWPDSLYKLVNGHNMMMTTIEPNQTIVMGVQSLSGSLWVNTLRPVLIIPVKTVYSTNINITSMLKRDDDCPNFPLVIKVNKVPVYDDMTYSQCSI
jgi:hypothetical protein